MSQLQTVSVVALYNCVAQQPDTHMYTLLDWETISSYSVDAAGTLPHLFVTAGILSYSIDDCMPSLLGALLFLLALVVLLTSFP